MSKCIKCGRKGFFQKLNLNGKCYNCEMLEKFENERNAIQSEINLLTDKLKDKDSEYKKLVQSAKHDALAEITNEIQSQQKVLEGIEKKKEEFALELDKLKLEVINNGKAASTAYNKTLKARELYKSAQYAVTAFNQGESLKFSSELYNDLDEFLETTVKLNFQCMDIQQLRKRFNLNKKLVKETLAKYQDRYTTKANIAIYRLMVIALEAELQNVLYTLSYEKLDKAISDVKLITAKFLKIASDGNQTIAPTVKSFIGEIEYFYIEAVKIEYEYYVQKERAKEEQRAIRAQMQQEAAERRELEKERQQLDKEESKFTLELGSVRAQIMEEKSEDKLVALQKRLEELQAQLEAVSLQREEILKRQNGKAGNVYVISNIGSFGEDVFKVGMTRRLDPQERVDELGDASVPFPFDVHSFIFSDDAVGLEKEMHKRLNNRRLNKINLRREFFRASLDEIENLVLELQPTIDFKRTILATQFRQSLSIDNVPEDYSLTLDDDIDDCEEDE